MFNFFKSNNLSQDKAYEMLQQDKSIKVIDVRTKEEFKDGHVKNSINIPLHTLPQKYVTTLPNKEAKVFIICYSGSRASEATDFLKRAGYTDVHNIGGVASWKFGLVR
jgi:phage shock protein E